MVLAIALFVGVLAASAANGSTRSEGAAPHLAQCPCFFQNGAFRKATANAVHNGATVTFSQAQPRVGSRDIQSLGEIAVESADQKNAIEFGWVVRKDNARARLYADYYVGGAGFKDGWVATGKPGAPHLGGTVSGAVGANGTYRVEYLPASGKLPGRWALSYNGSSIGYYPASLWSGKWTKVGLVQVFGEVQTSSYNKPRTQMGNGRLGTSTNPRSAVIKNFTLFGVTNQKPLGYFGAGNAALYALGARSPASCKQNCFLYYGGPGYTGS